MKDSKCPAVYRKLYCSGYNVPFNLHWSAATALATQNWALDALRWLARGSEAEVVKGSIYTPKPIREIFTTGHSYPPETHFQILCLQVFLISILASCVPVNVEVNDKLECP